MPRVPVTAILLLVVTSAAAREFGGYECTLDCSGHRSGYEWAEARDVKSPRQCDEILRRWPDRNAFYEGCLVYVDDPVRGKGKDDNEDEIE
jgi:hypothetical protein